MKGITMIDLGEIRDFLVYVAKGFAAWALATLAAWAFWDLVLRAIFPALPAFTCAAC
jgi:hypothetical protein